MNRYPSVDVEVMGSSRSELRNDLSRRAGHLLYNASAYGRKVEGTTAQDHDAFFTIWPSRKSENRLERVAAYNERIDGCYEFVVAMGFATARRQKVNIAARTRNESVDAGPDENRYGHRRLLTVIRIGGIISGARRPDQAPSIAHITICVDYEELEQIELA